MVRAGGRLEVVIPKTESGMSPPPHVVLTLFAFAFEDPRLHALLEQIVKEKNERLDAVAPPNP